MSSGSFRKVIRVAAVLLLVWTGVDLSADATGWGLCALDEAREHDVAGAMAALRIDDAADGSGEAPNEPSAHFDDCFCCSHCVNWTSASLPLEALHALEPVRELETRIKPPFRSPLYHPPLVLLG
ncbi:MAG: hypothetical protein AB7F99_13480 [Vicinamibacterales bacterium]